MDITETQWRTELVHFRRQAERSMMSFAVIELSGVRRCTLLRAACDRDSVRVHEDTWTLVVWFRASD